MAGTLSQIIQQEYKTKGAVSGLASGVGKSALEKADLRNLFFGGTGVTSIIGRKIFGKGYSATKRDTTPTRASLDQSDIVLSEIRDNTILSAKNSMALPIIAGQMNIMQKNIAKLVRAQKISPAQKADSFFAAAKFRENAYEASINSLSRKSSSLRSTVSPTAVPSGGDSSGFLGGLTAGLLGSSFLKLAKRLVPLVAIAGLVGIALTNLSGVIAKIVNFFANSWIGKKLGITPMDQPGDIGSFDEENKTAQDIESFSSKLIDAGAIAGATISGALAVKGVSKGVTAAKATKDAILDARTMSVQQMQKSKPTTKWGRFLRFMAIKNPGLFGRVGLRLAQAGALVAIPIGGWFGAIFTILGSVGLAWAVYQLWKEFSSSPEEIETDESPEQIGEEKGPVQLAGPENVSMDRSSVAQRATSKPTQQAQRRFGRFASLGGGTITGETTWNQLSKEQQDAVLAEQRKQEGFYPGSLTYDLNNPGAILYSQKAAQFGGVPDDTDRGVGDVKGKFAKFPTLEAGIEAQRDLWTRVYGNVPINEAIKKWTGNEQSAQSDYGKNLLAAANATPSPQGMTSATQVASVAPKKGAAVSSGSIEVADASRQLAMERTPPIINQDNRTFNNQTGQTAHGSTNPFAYDRELFQALISNAS